jgi:pyrroline-5-carboxylate reductase
MQGLQQTLAFIGGGNIANAIIGGLVASGHDADAILVIEPVAEQRERLRVQHRVRAHAHADTALTSASLVVWAVKPQMFSQAAAPCAAHVGAALQLSVMAGLRSDAIAAAIGTDRVVRAMPNTPALIGSGIAGLYARAGATAADRSLVEQVLRSTGALLWVDDEADLDAVTALSGSGPAYVFYFIEAMMQAAREMGLSDEQGRQLALATFAGATELASRSSDAPEVLREQVTSKGGTTHAAISSLEAARVKDAVVKAIRAAQQRARELGDEFGT